MPTQKVDYTSATEVAEALIVEMEFDNGCKFARDPRLVAKLVADVTALMKEGLVFSKEIVEEISTGEQFEPGDANAPEFMATAGYSAMNNSLADIFNSDLA